MSKEIPQEKFNEMVDALKGHFSDDQSHAIADAVWFMIQNIEDWEEVDDG